MAAAARPGDKASVSHRGAANLTYPAGQREGGGEHLSFFGVLVHYQLQQYHGPLDLIVCDAGLFLKMAC